MKFPFDKIKKATPELIVSQKFSTSMRLFFALH